MLGAAITRVYCNGVRLARLIYRPVYAAEYGPDLYCRGDMLMQRDSWSIFRCSDYRRRSRTEHRACTRNRAALTRFTRNFASYGHPVRYPFNLLASSTARFLGTSSTRSARTLKRAFTFELLQCHSRPLRHELLQLQFVE